MSSLRLEILSTIEGQSVLEGSGKGPHASLSRHYQELQDEGRNINLKESVEFEVGGLMFQTRSCM